MGKHISGGARMTSAKAVPGGGQFGTRKQWGGITRSPEFSNFYFGTNTVPTQQGMQSSLTGLSKKYDIANIRPDGNDGILITFREAQPGKKELQQYGNRLMANEMEVIGDNTWRLWWD